MKYADINYLHVKQAIEKKYHVKTKEMALFNGATSAIFALFSQLDYKRVYLYAPLYGEYETAIDSTKKIIKINRFTQMDTKVKKNSVVVFVNPSTPDAKYYDLDTMIVYWMKRECTIILDESFLEFEQLRSYRGYIKHYKKLYIIQSFSKFYSCAGVRIGAIFSHKKNIKSLQTPRWSLSSFDCEFLTKRLKDKSFEHKSSALHVEAKDELFTILNDSKLFDKIYKSDANFFLVRSTKSAKLFKHLLKYNILVRTCESFDFLDKNYLRFAVKDSDSHQQLKKALDAFS